MMLSRYIVVGCVITSLAFAAPHHRHLSVKAVADHGVVVYLSDGSAWEVRNENRPSAASWKAGTFVRVYSIQDSGWPYRLATNPGMSSGDIISVAKLVKVH
jgi:hypothetical protein